MYKLVIVFSYIHYIEKLIRINRILENVGKMGSVGIEYIYKDGSRKVHKQFLFNKSPVNYGKHKNSISNQDINAKITIQFYKPVVFNPHNIGRMFSILPLKSYEAYFR